MNPHSLFLFILSLSLSLSLSVSLFLFSYITLFLSPFSLSLSLFVVPSVFLSWAHSLRREGILQREPHGFLHSLPQSLSLSLFLNRTHTMERVDSSTGPSHTHLFSLSLSSILSHAHGWGNSSKGKQTVNSNNFRHSVTRKFCFLLWQKRAKLSQKHFVSLSSSLPSSRAFELYASSFGSYLHPR